MSPDDAVKEAAGLKVSVTDITPVRKSLAIEVAAEHVAAEHEKACRKYVRSLKVPGFRQGKVPLHIIKQRFGREIEQETIEHVIEHATSQAVDASGLKPLRTPVLKEYRREPSGSVTFTAEVEVRPRVTVKGAGDIRVRTTEPAVTDRMMADALESLRERAARFEPVEGRGLQTGDHALIDIAVAFEPGRGESFSRQNVLLELGSGGPNPEMTEPLRGLEPGQTREFAIDYPEDHPDGDLAGRRVTYTVSLREIKQKTLPALDDEFAKDLGAFSTLEELRRRVESDLMERERRRAREEARSSALDQLIESNPDVTVPDVLVDDEVDRRIDEIARTMILQGMDPRRAPVDWDDIREKQRAPAERSVRGMILLDALAEERKIILEPAELDRALAQEAARRQQTVEALRAKLTKDGRLSHLADQLLREKVLDFLLIATNT